MIPRYGLKALTGLLLFVVMGTVPIGKATTHPPLAGSISGKVVDASDGSSLPGANVVLKGTNRGAATDVQGNFTIPSVPSGQHTLVVSYVGYETVNRQVNVPDGGTANVRIEMTWQGVQGEEVTVSVQAKGQNQAINQQLSANTIKNVVSEARIEEIPDANAAESVGRLPGISIQRSDGEANKVAIRGLSPKYNNININGVSVPATGSSDRSVDLSMIAPNALAGIEVTKALTADQDADAIGGTVNLKLQEAQEGFHADVKANGGYNRLQSDFGNYKVAGSVSNRFLGGDLGIIASGNIESLDRSADRFNADYGQKAVNVDERQFKPLLNTLNLVEHVEDRDRLGGNLVLDYKLPGGDVVLNSFYSRLSTDQTNRTNQLSPIDKKHYYNFKTLETSQDIFTNMLQLEYTLGTATLNASASYSKTNSEHPHDKFYQFRENGAFSDDLNTEATPKKIQQAALNDTQAARLFNTNVFNQDSEESNTALSADLKIPFDISSAISGNVQFGGKYTHKSRSNDEQKAGQNLYYGGRQFAVKKIYNKYPQFTPPKGSQTIPYSLFVDEGYDAGGFLSGDYDLGPTAEGDQLSKVMDAIKDTLWTDFQASRINDYEGTEDLGAGYIMTSIKAGPVTFLPGVRYENKQTDYTASRVVGTQSVNSVRAIDSTATRTNSNFFPMIHLKVEPTRWMDVRLAYTKTLTRPDYVQISPRQFINTSRDYISRGNPTLKPSHATNYDASVAFHEAHLGLLTVSGFYKSIDDLIYQKSFPIIEGEGPLPDLNNRLPVDASGAKVDMSFNNPNDATYKGVEVSWQTNFWYLPSFLKGLVFNANFTHINAETKYTQFVRGETKYVPGEGFKTPVIDSTSTGRLVDQPRNILNATIGYDYKGFSARFTSLYQGNTVVSVAKPTAPTGGRYTQDYLRFDASLKQEVGVGLQVFANFNNIFARADRNSIYAGGRPSYIKRDYPTYTENYGFTMDLGIRYRY